MKRAAFWLPTILLGWVYMGYPAAAAVAGWLRPVRVRPVLPAPSLVTVGIVARDEGGQIGQRIEDLLAQVIPFDLEMVVVSDGSTDDTVAIVSRAAEEDPRIRVLDLPAVGQAAAQNAVFSEARGEIVVLTDAATRFAPRCLAALIAPFADPRIGCTTGDLEWRFERETDPVRHENLYWRYELLVRGLESRAGWLSTATGAVIAARRDGFRKVPPHASMDQLLPLHVRDDGAIVLAVHEARAFDEAWIDRDDQFMSRARIATQGIAANLSMVTRLTPWRRPSAFLAIWSHKLLRWATPVVSMVALVASARLVAGGRRRYSLPLAGGIGTLLLAAVGSFAERIGRPVRFASFPITVVTVNLAFLVGWLNLLRQRRIRSWQRPPSRPEGRDPGVDPVADLGQLEPDRGA